MQEFFHHVLVQPLYNSLVGVVALVPGHDVGIGIVLLTLIIRTLLLPVTHTQIKSQKSLATLQPKIGELRKKYAGKQQELGKAIMALYQKEKVNPLSSCLPVLVQLPFLYGLFLVFRTLGEGLATGDLYSFIPIPAQFHPSLFGFLDLTHPSIPLAVVAGGLQFVQTKMLPRPAVTGGGTGAQDEKLAVLMNRQAVYVFPVLTVIFGASFPAGLMLYWATSTLFSIAQQAIVLRTPPSQNSKSEARNPKQIPNPKF